MRRLSSIMLLASVVVLVLWIVVAVSIVRDKESNDNGANVRCDTYEVSYRVDCVDGETGEVVDSFTLHDVIASAGILEDEYINLNGDIVHIDEICE